MKKTIDEFGFDKLSNDFKKTQLKAYDVSVTAPYTYIRYTETDEDQAVHRVTETDSNTRIEWGWGTWAAKESLEYIPINDTREI